MLTIRTLLLSLFTCWMFSLHAQIKPVVLVMNIDTRDMLTDKVAMGNLARMEVLKQDRFEVIDRYDMMEILAEQEIELEFCFSKRCMLEAGRAMKANKVIGGNAERIGEKIIITLKLIDVATESVEKTQVGEFINEEREIEKMVSVNVSRLFGQEPEAMIVDNLSYYTTFDALPTTRIINNGPRMGMAYLTGDMADRFEAPLEQGGFDAYPYLSQFGYQHELQYLSAGSFQGLAEVLVMVSGLEQSMFIPSAVVMNGFRENKLGFEFAFGPSFSVRRMAEGYYTETGDWKMAREWDGPIEDRPALEQQLDKRGEPEFFSRWVWSVGKTFRSGYLNIPVNVYASPRKEDWMVGLSVGFNVRKGKK